MKKICGSSFLFRCSPILQTHEILTSRTSSRSRPVFPAFPTPAPVWGLLPIPPEAASSTSSGGPGRSLRPSPVPQHSRPPFRRCPQSDRPRSIPPCRDSRSPPPVRSAGRQTPPHGSHSSPPALCREHNTLSGSCSPGRYPHRGPPPPACRI